MASKKKEILEEEDEDIEEEETIEKKPIKSSTRSKKKTKKSREDTGRKLQDETRHMVFGVIFFALAAFLIVAGFGHGGPAGAFFKNTFTYLFGVGYCLIPALFIIIGITFMKSGRPIFAFMQTLGSLLFLVGSLGLIDIASTGSHDGGIVGSIAALPFVKLFDTFVATLFLGAVLVISIIILFDSKPDMLIFKRMYEKMLATWNAYVEHRKSKRELVVNHMDTSDEKPSEKTPKEEPTEPEPDEETSIDGENEFDLGEKKLKAKSYNLTANYVPPPLEILASDKGKPNVGDIKANANIIKRSLSNFGLEVEMDEVTIGPTVTRYALKPAEGVKLSRIVGLQNDLALALAAHPIRIEAPIPGKSLVGIEIPNRSKSIVGLGTILADEKFVGSEKPLTVALGRSIDGMPHFGNLARMPHVLVAGATGAGKSVTIHSIVTSLLYRNGPEAMRFIMIDPKRVELTLYKNIPHLLTPVITDAKKAILSLKWAAKEMDRRYDILESESVRDIESYHKNVVAKQKATKGSEAPLVDPMPYIVIIIDELADIMQSYPRELEAAIVRLAQMSRAVGIHLLLSTQRPSVNVITGLIKANIPARIALQVSSQIDSRTILDQGGAEKLLGAGDMLFLAGDMPQPVRLQCAFISESEVKAVVKWIVDHNEVGGADEITFTGNISPDKSIFEAEIGGGDDDELYEDARMTVIEAGKASTSFLQRKLGVGYARAARLIDMLEERNVVGPGSGAKPREVLEKPGEGFSDEGMIPDA